jgi:Rrf2 family protein
MWNDRLRYTETEVPGNEERNMITTTGTYALRAMSYMARHPLGTRVSAQSLGRDLGIPVTYLGKVLQSLARFQLLEGYRGRHGGYRMVNSPKKISLYEVLSAVERVDRYGKCMLGHEACPGEDLCPMHSLWGLAEGKARTLLQKTTVEELAWHDEQADRLRETPVTAAKARPKKKITAVCA